MALAKYFSKDLLAINRLISTEQSSLENIINSKVVTLAFDINAINTFEGKCGLDLIIRLLARFYPKMKVIDLSEENEEKREELISLAKKINSNIEILSQSEEEDIFITAGFTKKEAHTNGYKFYFGSENWISKYSISEVQNFGESNNPFGCGMSACILSSNIFRKIFFEFIDFKLPDEEVDFSVFSLDFESKENPRLEEIVFKDVVIAGIGAIGNGTIWALSKIESLKGELALVDDETISRSNLQRYVLFTEDDENKEKVIIAKEHFLQNNINILPFKGTWKDYVNERNEWNIECVAVGIDNENDRIGIQSTLPLIIFNSFTELELIGITRHLDFINEPCLACSYITTSERKNRTTEIAENCKIPDKVDLVKEYFNYNVPVNEIIPGYSISLLEEIAKANDIPIEDLKQYIGKKIDQFYSDFICGGAILNLSKIPKEIKNVDAPLAFQSVMAGILLAAELVKYHLYGNLKQEIRTDLYHLSPISVINPFHRKLGKDKSGRCLCTDSDFRERYEEKWKTQM